MVNSLCLTFTWPFFIDYYQKCIICKKCDRLVATHYHQDTFVNGKRNEMLNIESETPAVVLDQ